MSKSRKRILAVIMVLAMIVSAQSFAFAAESRTLSSSTGFKIVDASDQSTLVKAVKIQMIAEDGSVMGETVCSDGENFLMENIGQAKIKNFLFSASGYKDTEVEAKATLGIGENWFNKAGAISQQVKAVTVTMEKDETGIHTLSGTITVTDSATGDPISGASISLLDRDDSNQVKYTKVLEADGTFTINNIVPGNYGWIISADGYISSDMETSGMGALKNLTDPQTKKLDERVALIKKTEGTATISGTVKDDADSPVKNASVQLKSGNTAVGAAVTTGADGSFKMEKVEAGTYTLEASASGYGTGTTEAFTVSDGETVTGKNIVLEKEVKAVISGKVTDAEGNPIDGYVSVGLYQNGKNIATGSANSQGEYTIGSKGWGYEPGEYEIQVSSKGYISQTLKITVPKQETYTVPTIKLAVDPMKDASISGVLRDAKTGEPISGTISWSKDGVFGGSRSVASTGEYTITGLRAGTYTVTASATNYADAELAPIVLEDKTYEQNITGKDLYLGEAGMTTAILSGRITAESSFEGQTAAAKAEKTSVRTAEAKSGTSGASIKVSLIREDQVVDSKNCEADGSYVFTGIDPGTYTVRAEKDGYVIRTTEAITLKSGQSVGGNDLSIYRAIVLEQIKVTKLPDKVTYREGELLDTAGMVVTAYYSDGNSKVINDYNISGYALVPGKNIIVVTYSEDGVEQETSFTVTVWTESADAAGASDRNGNGKNENGGSGTSESRDGSVQTGDDRSLDVLWILSLLGAATAGGALVFRRKGIQPK